MCDNSDLAWAAGFLDGEAAFSVQITGGRTFSTHINAYQIVREPLDKLQSLFGGTITYRPARQATHREGYAYHAYGAVAGRLAAAVRPWLTVKGKLADLIIEFEALPRVPAPTPMTEDQLRLRVELYARAKEMNGGRR